MFNIKGNEHEKCAVRHISYVIHIFVKITCFEILTYQSVLPTFHSNFLAFSLTLPDEKTLRKVEGFILIVFLIPLFHLLIIIALPLGKGHSPL